MPTTNTITPADFHRLAQQGPPPTLLDVRTPPEFARVHAVGATSLPLDELTPATIAARLKDAPGPLYVICQSGTRSAAACQRLAAAGVGPAYSVEGGTAAWERQGLPVHRGDPSACRVPSLERQVRIAAGTLVLLGLALAWALHPAFLAIPTFVGAGLVFAGVTDRCGMAVLLAKLPWNRRRA